MEQSRLPAPAIGARAHPGGGQGGQSKAITDISGLSHGVGWWGWHPAAGRVKADAQRKGTALSPRRLSRPSGCSGMTHSPRWRGKSCRQAYRSAQHGPCLRPPINVACAKSSSSSPTAKQSAFSEGDLPSSALRLKTSQGLAAMPQIFSKDKKGRALSEWSKAISSPWRST